MTKTFKNYDVTFNGHEKEVEEIRAFLKNDKKHLIIVGSTGRGKSHLCEAIANEAGRFINDQCQNENYVKFIKAEMLYYLFLKEAYGMDINKFFLPKNSLRQIIKSPIVIIDDLGSEKREPKDKENFVNAFKIFVDEFNRKLIITSNLDMAAMTTRYGEKIISRLFDVNITDIVVLEGKDYRDKK